MDPQALKILFIGNEDGFARHAAEAVETSGGTLERAEFDRAASVLKNNSFSAILFEPGTPNTASLFQVTALTIQAPHLPIIVVGSVNDESFAVETINAGAQGYLAREEFQPHLMLRTIRCAIERQIERVALVAEKENYYGIFDHLIEGIFRTTPDGHYMMANVALARIYGYDSPADVIAKITDIAHSLYVEPRPPAMNLSN